LLLLPHRPPMRLVEEIVEIVPGQRAITRRIARPEDWFFDGHFPGQPVIPAIALVELLAQTGGLAAGAPGPGVEPRPLQLRVAALGPFKFPAGAGPGVILEADARVVGAIGGLYKIEGQVRADSTIVATGSLTLAEARP
jgi:3-hydroxyacyl-[acyl-carrier-protein] dehydratase